MSRRRNVQSGRPGRRPRTTVWALAVLAAAGLTAAVRVAGAQPAEPGLPIADAMELALSHDPAIALVATRVDSSRGALAVASGRFDSVVGADASREESRLPGAADQVTTVTSLGLFRQLRSGLTLEPAVELARVAEDGREPGNRATVSFALRQPLLRGRGGAVVAAAERSAEGELEASRLDLQHAVSARLAAVADQYWRVVAAALDLEVLETTEESSRELMETTRRLIAADVTPAAEAVQVEADLAVREANRIAGERSLFAARQALGEEIGLPPEAIADLPLPSDPFPRVDAAEVPPAASEGLRFAREALARRADLAAARERLAAARLVLVSARNGLRPQLDLLFTPSYTGAVAGDGVGDFLSPLVDHVPGVSTLVALSLAWPIENRAAEGALIQTEADADRAALELDRIAKAIGAETPAALDAVARSALQVDRAEAALQLFERAVENEEKKLRGGTSTLINLITQRDRLIEARRRRVQARLELALALVELRFQTGTLVTGSGDAGTLHVEDLSTVPELGPP